MSSEDEGGIVWDAEDLHDEYVICSNCNEPTEIGTGYGSEEICYGHGHISTIPYEYKASMCCQSDFDYELLIPYAYTQPCEAYEANLISKRKMVKILKFIKAECYETYHEIVGEWKEKYGGVFYG